MGHCSICNRALDVADDPYSLNCGGDCLMCLAEARDPDCVRMVLEIAKKDAKRLDALVRNPALRVLGGHRVNDAGTEHVWVVTDTRDGLAFLSGRCLTYREAIDTALDKSQPGA